MCCQLFTLDANIEDGVISSYRTWSFSAICLSVKHFCRFLILRAAAERTMGIMRLDLMQSLMLIPIRCWLSG